MDLDLLCCLNAGLNTGLKIDFAKLYVTITHENVLLLYVKRRKYDEY